MRTFTTSTPSIRVLVRNRFLGLENDELTEGYLVGITSIPSRPLFFTVHLSTGALWSRLPISALLCDRFLTDKSLAINSDITLDNLQPYSCLNGDIQVYTYEHLKNYTIECLKLNRKGIYLFTVDVIGEGLTEDPEQHKTHNICVLDTGELIAMPNNMLKFIDEYFTNNEIKLPNYRRNSKYYVAN